MKTTRHPPTFDTDREFPNARMLRGWEGGAAYAAERDGAFFIVIDESTMSDFLDEDDPTDRDVLDRLVTVLEFPDEQARDRHAAEAFPKRRR